MQTNSLVYTDKSNARAELSHLRASLCREDYSLTLCENIAKLDEYAKAETLLLYFPTRSEPDLTSLFQMAKNDGKQVALPISEKESSTLDFRLIASLGELSAGAYGIREPQDSAPRAELGRRTLCIVPALAVDRDGYRLGYGKGYYDRFLSTFAGDAIVAIHSSLVCDRLPRYETDVPVKTIITQTGVLRPR